MSILNINMQNSESNFDSYYSEEMDVELFGSNEVVVDQSLELKYRSVVFETRPSVDYFAESQAYSSPSKSSNMISMAADGKVVFVASETGSSSCPPVPCGIAATNFAINKIGYNAVIQMISNALAAETHYDFSFIEKDSMVSDEISISGIVRILVLTCEFRNVSLLTTYSGLVNISLAQYPSKWKFACTATR